ncbi:RNA chaperone Hfq [Sphingomonas xanthus]|uniref:RNA-binding protein Hfq n=1 Tax=Sphingomonas xanthus TaxID=2594473 RepID=A0A516INV3_9SPHN|nr:RNA chaperone Hfq [Sphingomonas xanthus]QDP18600.1 RNA chaperone Hfq [Sphingomonas xanthus]
MAEKTISLQDQFLNSIRKAKTPATIFLVKGVKLQGIVTWFDSFSLLLRRDGNSQLVYKHGISTIMPAQPPADLNLEGEGGSQSQRRPVLQDLFLNAAKREHEPMTMFLVNGVMLQGSVAAFDQFSLLLERGGQVQLVYKHAISTMQPTQPLQLGGQDSREEED